MGSLTYYSLIFLKYLLYYLFLCSFNWPFVLVVVCCVWMFFVSSVFVCIHVSRDRERNREYSTKCQHSRRSLFYFCVVCFVFIPFYFMCLLCLLCFAFSVSLSLFSYMVCYVYVLVVSFPMDSNCVGKGIERWQRWPPEGIENRPKGQHSRLSYFRTPGTARWSRARHKNGRLPCSRVYISLRGMCVPELCVPNFENIFSGD